MVRRHERLYSAMSYIENRGDIDLDKRYEKADFPRAPSRNSISVCMQGTDTAGAQNVVTSVIHDTFLIMNIAAPGCCDFYRASLVGGGRGDAIISLSNYHFEAALMVHVDNKWPLTRVLNLQDVITWFDAVRSGMAQIPQNSVERALFALLHIAQSEASPMSVIWLFYAFESLLQTKIGENFSMIVKRLALLLDADSQQAEVIRRRMRALYDIRSAIVHGGFEVIHPMNNELLDRRADHSFISLLSALDHGYAILLACIQSMIERKWRLARFEESVRGEVL